MASPSPADLPNGATTPPPPSAQTPVPAPSLAVPPQSSPAPLPSTPQMAPPMSGAGAAAQLSAAMNDPGLAKRPRDARLIHLLLATMGVHAYAERVPLQILDFAYRYTSSILSDAVAFETPGAGTQRKAGGGASKDDDGLTVTALRTAIATRIATQFHPTLPQDFALEMMAERNKIALPRPDRDGGLRLPSERHCLTGVGWTVRESWEDEVADVGTEAEPRVNGHANGTLEDRPEASSDAAAGGSGPAGADAGEPMEEDDDEENQFEEVMGLQPADTEMVDA